MNLQKLRIESKDFNSNSTCTVIMTYELVEFDADDVRRGAESYAVLHRVQLEPTPDADLKIDVPLDDSEVREHFESLLSVHCHGYDVHTTINSEVA